MITKAQLIEEICNHNVSATPEFLSEFSYNELVDYLRQLQQLLPLDDEIERYATCEA